MLYLPISVTFRQFACNCSAQVNVTRLRHLTSSVCCASMAASRDGNKSKDDSSGWTYPIISSERVKEKKSVFLAHASTLPNASEVSVFIEHLTSLPTLKRATHCMYAYRVVPDSANTSNKTLGQHDGGERGSGERLSRLLDVLECENVIVVVSRWYGGVPLGSDRWKIISRVAKEALHKGGFVKERSTNDTTVSNKPKSKKNKKKR